MVKAKRVTRVDLVVSDHHKGLVRAIRRYLQGAIWQRCQAHFMRNIMDRVPEHLVWLSS